MAKKPTVLIDGDIVVFRACAACEKDIRWDEFNHALTSNTEECWDAALSILDGIYRDTGTTDAAVALSGGDNFRKRLSAAYKRHRGRKPLNYSFIRERLEQHLPCKTVETLEGDDLLGIWQTSGQFGETILWSGDKDMLGVPGKHWNIQRGLVEVTEDQADYFWMTQVLTGDTTDGYTGLVGFGPVTAKKALGDAVGLEALWAAVLKAYESKGLGYDDALLQARLSRILRVSDWDSKRKEVKLWEPTWN